MTFFTPLFFILSILLPVTVCIYLLRRRYKQNKVASLILWHQVTGADTRGTVVRRQRVPWILLLELLIVTLLILSAVSPGFRVKQSPPVVCLLDNSWSMTALDSSARTKTINKISEMVDSENRLFYLVRVDKEPTLLGKSYKDSLSLNRLFKNWKCDSVECDLLNAVAWAKKLYPEAQIRIFSDNVLQAKKFTDSDLYTVGTAVRNVAIINARRKNGTEKDTILFELFNAGNSENTVPVKLICDNSSLNSQLSINLKPKEKRVVRTTIGTRAGKVTLSIPADAMAFDNVITLFPEQAKQVKVKLLVKDAFLKTVWKRSLQSLDFVKFVDSSEEILVTDTQNSQTTGECVIQLVKGKKSKAFVGPYVKRGTHRILEGIELDGVVWGAFSETAMTGNKLLSIGSLPLFTLKEAQQQKILQMNFDPKLSNLPKQPVWPALVWNIMAWGHDSLKGIKRYNYRQTELLNLTLPNEAKTVSITTPSGLIKAVEPVSHNLFYTLDKQGVYTVKFLDQTHEIVVSPFDAGESDLRQSTSKTILNKQNLVIDDAFIDITWIFILVALLFLMLHQFLIQKGSR